MNKYEVVIRERTYRTIEVFADNIEDGINRALVVVEDMRLADDPNDRAEVVAIEEAGWRNT